MQYLDPQTQTLYQTLLAECTSPLFIGANTSFSKKTVKEKSYWYAIVSIGTKRFEKYLGPDNAETKNLISAEKELWNRAKSETKTRAKLVAMYIAGGGSTINTTDAKILTLVERSGAFMAGGVLVGTPAYRVLADVLGVQWPSDENMQTRDIDIAGDNRYSVVIADKGRSLLQILKESNMGLLEIPSLNHKHPSTSYRLRSLDYQIDMLTPMLGKPDGSPILLKSLQLYAKPVRYMDFLLEHCQHAVIAANTGIVVNVPSPGHFALHKLVISQRRPAIERLKSEKDIRQAENILQVLFDSRPGEVLLAYEDAEKMGTKFCKAIDKAILTLNETIQSSWKEWIN